MMCKIVRFQNLMLHNIMRSTKSQKSFGFTLYYRFVGMKNLVYHFICSTLCTTNHKKPHGQYFLNTERLIHGVKVIT